MTVVTSAANSGGELLEVAAEWAPIETRPPVHLHPHQGERFAVSEGALAVEMDGEVRVIRAGESLEAPRGTAHRMWNDGDAVCRAAWQVRPALRTEDFFAAVHASRAHRRSRRGGTITLLGAGPIMRAFSGEFRPAMPGLLARPLAAVLTALAHGRGYPRVERRRPGGEHSGRPGTGPAHRARPARAGSG